MKISLPVHTDNHDIKRSSISEPVLHVTLKRKPVVSIGHVVINPVLIIDRNQEQEYCHRLKKRADVLRRNDHIFSNCTDRSHNHKKNKCIILFPGQLLMADYHHIQDNA